MSVVRRQRLAVGVARFARDLAGRSSSRLLTLLVDQLDATSLGVTLVSRLAAGEVSPAQARDEMRELEHAGDDSRAELVGHIGRVLSTPIDPEDLFRLSRSIDDVLDNLRDFVREVDLYHPEDLALEAPLIRALADGVESMRTAVAELRAPRGNAREATLATRKAAGGTRRLYQQQVAALFDLPLDAETLKHRELLRRLDVVGLRLGEAADALADGALKRSR
ncbi:MAG: DUF47 family protein [Actinomycetota bacterium]|nr:DUF47 family protein [Actinomycetota bacterium]